MLIPNKNKLSPAGKVTAIKRYADPAVTVVTSEDKISTAESGEDPSSTIDHGTLLGLGDDDHTGYHNDDRAATWLAANHETTYTHTDIALNTTHRGSSGTDHANVVLNDTHRTSDGKDHSDVALNNTHRTSTGVDHTYIDQDVTQAANPTYAGIIISDAGNIVLGTTTGTKIGTTAAQKIGLHGVTPVAQQSHIIDANGTLADMTTKFNTLLSQLETLGVLASA